MSFRSNKEHEYIRTPGHQQYLIKHAHSASFKHLSAHAFLKITQPTEREFSYFCSSWCKKAIFGARCCTWSRTRHFALSPFWREIFSLLRAPRAFAQDAAPTKTDCEMLCALKEAARPLIVHLGFEPLSWWCVLQCVRFIAALARWRTDKGRICADIRGATLGVVTDITLFFHSAVANGNLLHAHDIRLQWMAFAYQTSQRPKSWVGVKLTHMRKNTLWKLILVPSRTSFKNFQLTHGQL